MLYTNYRRPNLKKEKPSKTTQNICLLVDVLLTDLSKLIGEEWKNLSAEHKKVIFTLKTCIRFGMIKQKKCASNMKSKTMILDTKLIY